jgi:phosphotransferase system HPr (HPr) family protein
MAMEKTLQITNKYGLHARASTRFAQVAMSFRSSIQISREREDQKVDAKSVLGILSLGAERGELIRVRVDGEDAHDAMEAVTQLFLRNFDEE